MPCPYRSESANARRMFCPLPFVDLAQPGACGSLSNALWALVSASASRSFPLRPLPVRLAVGNDKASRAARRGRGQRAHDVGAVIDEFDADTLHAGAQRLLLATGRRTTAPVGEGEGELEYFQKHHIENHSAHSRCFQPCPRTI